jgi:hypothetical protein
MQQAAGESPQQCLPSRPLPCNLVDKAYMIIPCRKDFASWLEQQEAAITYLSVWLSDGQPITFYSPPKRYFPHGVPINCTLSKCTQLPWVINRFYIHGLDRDYHFNRATQRALDAINARTRYMDNHPELEDHPDDARAPQPNTGPLP